MPAKVRFNLEVAEDEIDLESGFIMLPQGIPQAAPPAVCPKCGKSPCQCMAPPPPCPKCRRTPCVCTVPPLPCPKCGKRPCVCSTPPPPPVTEKTVELTFTADSTKLYQAFSALANLADMAGQVSVTVKAESETGFDKSKLTNGVLEPLREANLIQ